jgi:nucleotide-binding universal stress UspA family protein
MRASRELLKKGEKSLEKRAVELESVLGRHPEIMVASGDATAVIQEAAEAGGEPTLVAMGSRSLGVIRHFPLGSVSTGVLRAVGDPVLIVPSPGN